MQNYKDNKKCLGINKMSCRIDAILILFNYTVALYLEALSRVEKTDAMCTMHCSGYVCEYFEWDVCW